MLLKREHRRADGGGDHGCMAKFLGIDVSPALLRAGFGSMASLLDPYACLP
jgi:hypothetical protein